MSVWRFFMLLLRHFVYLRVKHCGADENKTSLNPLDRLKKLRTPAETSKESAWSRDIPVIRWFSSHGAIFQENTQLSPWPLSIQQLTFHLCWGMINAPWHSFYVSREGHRYLLLDSEISSNLSKTWRRWHSRNKTAIDPGLQISVQKKTVANKTRTCCSCRKGDDFKAALNVLKRG